MRGELGLGLNGLFTGRFPRVAYQTIGNNVLHHDWPKHFEIWSTHGHEGPKTVFFCTFGTVMYTKYLFGVGALP